MLADLAVIRGILRIVWQAGWRKVGGESIVLEGCEEIFYGDRTKESFLHRTQDQHVESLVLGQIGPLHLLVQKKRVREFLCLRADSSGFCGLKVFQV